MSHELNPGERKERARGRRRWLVIGLLALAGFVPGFMLGFSEGEGLFDPSRVWPTWIVLLLAGAFVLSVSIGGWFLHRQMDELERNNHYKAAAAAGGVFLLGYPVWWLLWMGDLAPEPVHWLLFLGFYLTLAVSTIYYRMR